MLQSALAAVLTATDTTITNHLDKLIDSFNYIIETLQHIGTFVLAVAVVFAVFNSIFGIRRSAQKHTKRQLESMKSTGKYIPGLFVELNETKEILRFFVHGEKWRIKLIHSFNSIYQNVYGDILKSGTVNRDLTFHLNSFASLKKISDAVDHCLEYHNQFRKRQVQMKPEYKESIAIFEIHHHQYTKMLNELQNEVKAATCNYIVLTGSAGNGKTNLFCSISELAIKLGHTVVLLNSRDINGNITEHIIKCLNIHNVFVKHKNCYFKILNTLLKIRKKKLLVFIDAINENDNSQFGNEIKTFVNEMEHYSSFKIAVSCRNEYFEERFAESISDNVNQCHLIYDLKTESYPQEAVDRLIDCYKDFYHFNGYISDEVLHIICEHLLLLRVFFEVNQRKNQDILSIQKHEIFKKYIHKVKESVPNIEKILDSIADTMLSNMTFDYIDLDTISTFAEKDIYKVFDETILLNRKIIYHQDTIASQEKECVFFVFDEIRDYYLANRIVQNNTKYEYIDGDAILSEVQKICEAQVSCEEGIIQYIYVLFKTAEISEEERAKYCAQILDIYRIHKGHTVNYYKAHHREKFANYGLKILFTAGLPLVDFEFNYIRDCLVMCPKEDGGKIFDTALEGTRFGLSIDLNFYFDLLFGLKDKETIIRVYKTMPEDSFLTNVNLPYDLVPIHQSLNISYPERAVQIQKAAELYMMLFKSSSNPYQDNNFQDYFNQLDNHAEVCEEMRERYYQAIGEKNDGAYMFKKQRTGFLSEE